jgi:hypothetical protein
MADTIPGDPIAYGVDRIAKEAGVDYATAADMIDDNPGSEMHQRFVAYVMLAMDIRAGKVPDRSKMS